MKKCWLYYLMGLLLIILTGLGLSRSPGAAPVGGGGMVRIPDTPPVVALTFDDGPNPDTTARLLDELALREIPATFFLVGERITGNEELVRRMAREGHQVGVHSTTHRQLTDLSREDFDREVALTRAQLTAILGQGEYWLRPPYGIIDPSVQQWADSPIILWSLDSLDWEDRNTSRIVSDVLSRVQDGDVILFHDIYPTTVDAIVRLADVLLERGYCFATVEQLMSARNITPQPGALIRRIQ